MPEYQPGGHKVDSGCEVASALLCCSATFLQASIDQVRYMHVLYLTSVAERRVSYAHTRYIQHTSIINCIHLSIHFCCAAELSAWPLTSIEQGMELGRDGGDRCEIMQDTAPHLTKERYSLLHLQTAAARGQKVYIV